MTAWQPTGDSTVSPFGTWEGQIRILDNNFNGDIIATQSGERAAAWSPDGSQIVLVKEIGASVGDFFSGYSSFQCYYLATMDLIGNELEKISDARYAMALDWID